MILLYYQQAVQAVRENIHNLLEEPRLKVGHIQYRSELSEPKTRVLNEPLTR